MMGDELDDALRKVENRIEHIRRGNQRMSDVIDAISAIADAQIRIVQRVRKLEEIKGGGDAGIPS